MSDNFSLSADSLSYSVEINALRLYARHGVMDQERSVGNLFEVSAVLRLPASEAIDAIAGDSLAGAVNYAEVAEVIRREMLIPSALLEHVAGRIILALRKAFPGCNRISVKIAKLTPPVGLQMGSAAVSLSWSC